MKEHDFRMQLPFNGVGAEISMDGQELDAVTSVCIKAGHSGFTNVAVEFAAPAFVETRAALFARLASEEPDWAERELAPLLSQAIAEKTEQHLIPLLNSDKIEFTETEMDFRGAVAQRFLELLVEQGTAPDVSDYVSHHRDWVAACTIARDQYADEPDGGEYAYWEHQLVTLRRLKKEPPTPYNPELYARVKDALDLARDNGYDQYKAPAGEVVSDLHNLTDAFEGDSEDELLVVVYALQKLYG